MLLSTMQIPLQRSQLGKLVKSCFHGWCIPVVLCYKGLIQLCRVHSVRQSVCRGQWAGSGEQQLIGHQQGPLLQVGWHLALILVLEIK